MPVEMPRAQGGIELERTEKHEKYSRDDVDKSENGMTGEDVVGDGELCGNGIGR